MIVTVTDATFDALVRRAELPVLLDFTATWCPPAA
jgi:thioredoxin 1